MSVLVSSWVFHQSESTGNDRLVLLALADEADDQGRNAYPSVDLLARKARLNRATVLRAIARLEGAGELLVLRPETHGRGRHNSYCLVIGRDPGQVAGEIGWPSPAPAGAEEETSQSATIPEAVMVAPDATIPASGNVAECDHSTAANVGNAAKNGRARCDLTQKLKDLKPKRVQASTDVAAVSWTIPSSVLEAGFLDQALELCDHFAELLTERGHRVTARSKAWVLAMEAMLRIDAVPAADVRATIDWLTYGTDRTAHFWRTNVLSPDKLRQRYPTLLEQFRGERTKPSGRQPALARVTASDLAQRLARIAQ